MAALCLLSSTLFACAQSTTPVVGKQPDAAVALQRIALGSCVDAHKPVPAFDAIIQAKPDLMIFLGDNVYADSFDEHEIRRAYNVLGEHDGFRRLQGVCPILATWDDHDYGLNDSGNEHPDKAGSQRAFMDFWNVPQDAPRRSREGVYDAAMFGPQGRRVQVILLDTRYHRDPLVRLPKDKQSRAAGRYQPNPDPDAQMLGEAQWAWLKDQLTRPADLRLIVSSVQVVPEQHGWEGWATFPHQRTRLIELIRNTGAHGVVFLSGDRHHAELSRLEQDTPYPLYDLTSSSLNRPSRDTGEPNRHRVGKLYPLTNFGLITLDWDAQPATVTLQIIDASGGVQIEQTVALPKLRP